jgi:hypothetical protein
MTMTETPPRTDMARGGKTNYLEFSIRLGIGAAALVGLAGCGSVSPAGQAPCPVTQPNGIAPQGEAPSADWYAENGLTTVLWPDGTVVFQPGGPGEMRADGSLAMKFPFTRGPGVSGALVIHGRRLDGEAAPASGEIPEGYGDSGFQASAIVFPTAGCWEITAQAGSATMTFVQRVIVSKDTATP